jgi:hypothetical protein
MFAQVGGDVGVCVWGGGGILCMARLVATCGDLLSAGVCLIGWFWREVHLCLA